MRNMSARRRIKMVKTSTSSGHKHKGDSETVTAECPAEPQDKAVVKGGREVMRVQ